MCVKFYTFDFRSNHNFILLNSARSENTIQYTVFLLGGESHDQGQDTENRQNDNSLLTQEWIPGYV